MDPAQLGAFMGEDGARDRLKASRKCRFQGFFMGLHGALMAFSMSFNEF